MICRHALDRIELPGEPVKSADEGLRSNYGHGGRSSRHGPEDGEDGSNEGCCGAKTVESELYDV